MLQQVGELHSTLISLRPPVVILPHANADIDAVASAVGVQSFLKKHGIASVLFFPSLSAPAAKILRDFAIDYATDLDLDGKDVVVVDTSSSSMLPVDIFPSRRVVVLDHHDGGDLRGYVFATPSLSEIIADLLLMDGVRDRRAYTLLAAGIYSDTAGLIAADAHSLKTLGSILEHVDMDVGDIARIVSSRPNVSERIARLKAARKMKIHRFGDFVVVTSKSGAFEGSIAWFFILAGADVALVAGRDRIIARMSNDFIFRTGVDLTDLFSAVAKKIGASWGGHPGAAGMRVSDVDSALEALLSELGTLLHDRGFHFVRRDY